MSSNEQTIREAIEGVVRKIEAGEHEDAKANCDFLLEDHFDRLMRPSATPPKTISRSASPPIYGMDDFGRERVLSVNNLLKSTLQNLIQIQANHESALVAAKEALETWNRGHF